jgi:hypothetical protein
MLQQILANYFTTRQPKSFTLDVPAHDPDRDNSKFRVSDAGKCHRMRFWKRQGQPGTQEIPFETQMAMQTGNLLHAFLQYALDREGVLFAAETPLEDAHRIGHLDAILHDRHDHLLLYDFKTVGGKQMYYLKQEMQPKKEHSFQIRTYEQMHRATYPDLHITEAVIAYINRDTFEILELPAAGAVSEVDRDWSPLYGYWDRQETPPKTNTSWECKYCQYKTQCLPGG